jgi:hypothetical protein
MLDLTSVRAKLARSQEHAQAVNREIESWSHRYPYSLVKKRNSDSTRFSLFLYLNEPPPLQHWSLMMADAFGNLRNALDHLVYAIATHEAAPSVPLHEGSLQFPITDCRSRFDAEVSKHKLGVISGPIRAAIEMAQPYNRPHEALPPLLSILRQLTNRDKHKLLHVAFTTIQSGDIGFSGTDPQEGRIWNVEVFTGEVEDGTEVCAYTCDIPQPNMDFDRHVIDIAVAIGHNKRDPSGPDWQSRTSFPPLFEEISGEVRRIIYEVSGKFFG